MAYTHYHTPEMIRERVQKSALDLRVEVDHNETQEPQNISSHSKPIQDPALINTCREEIVPREAETSGDHGQKVRVQMECHSSINVQDNYRASQHQSKRFWQQSKARSLANSSADLSVLTSQLGAINLGTTSYAPQNSVSYQPYGCYRSPCLLTQIGNPDLVGSRAHSQDSAAPTNRDLLFPESTSPPRSIPAIGPDTTARDATWNNNRPNSRKKKQKLERDDRAREVSTPFENTTVLKPQATVEYLEQAGKLPQKLSKPQRLLIVLDVNGTLGYRPKASQHFRPRPYLEEFLGYCFDRHEVLIWSSAMPSNLNPVCKKILSQQQLDRVIGIWGRDTLRLSKKDYNDRVQVYKKLQYVWEDEDVQSFHPERLSGKRWGQSNTVLVDDSTLKAASQPFNHIKVPEFVKHSQFDKEKALLVLEQVQNYIDEVSNWVDVSCFIKHFPLVIQNLDLMAGPAQFKQDKTR